MSFILDALRKSEQERQRNRAPGIADMRAPEKQRHRGLWLPLVALLAGLNLALLGVLWVMGNDDPEPAAAGSLPTNAVTNPATPQAAASSGRRLSAELEAPEQAREEGRGQAPETLEPARFASISPPAPRSTAATGDRIPTVTEAMLDGSLSIAPLHLDIHVYSDNPAERFVFINTTRYGEGERTREGPNVKTINAQGVILNYQGRDYLLARD